MHNRPSARTSSSALQGDAPLVIPPLPAVPGQPRDGSPTLRRVVPPNVGQPAIRIGGSPRDAAAARQRVGATHVLPGIGDPIRPTGTADTIMLSGSEDEIDPRVSAQIDRMQDEELGSDEGDRDGFDKVQVSGTDFVDSE